MPKPHTNALAGESSPYLLQHAHNPVHWYPWGDEALQKAREEDKMIIVSVGYAACHWCHVMERESFEDEEVAAIMNEHFIAIKVDREERPDVDQVYMDAAQLITGRGGWPLNAFALPNGRPFYAGTYFPKKDWVRTLHYFVELRQKNPEKLIEQAEKVTQGIGAIDHVPQSDRPDSYSMGELDESFRKWLPNFDKKRGGENRAPKFPMPATWEYLLHYAHISDNEDALDAVTTTLDNMARGGIYDHIGGGFARYSVDARWHIPHFEKMLYDNAQLVELYAKAWQKTKNPLYKKVVYETLEYIEREMTSPENGFYSSLDADSDDEHGVSEEGAFYVWTKDGVENILGEDSRPFIDYYNIKGSGNWEKGKNILFVKDKTPAPKHIEESKAKLLTAREKRARPALDDKILTSWNALMLRGYVWAYRAFDEGRFLESALDNARFLQKNAFRSNGEILRVHKDGKTTVPGFLDDYAFVISAFIKLYQATFNESWLYTARKLADYTTKHFFDPASGLFFYTHDDHSNLITRKKELSDNVIPSSNSEMAKNLYMLGHYFYDEAYLKMSGQMLANMRERMDKHFFFHANWAVLKAWETQGPYEVAIMGSDFNHIRKEWDDDYHPNAFLLGGADEGRLELLENKLIEGETMIYVCRDKVCKFPVTTVAEALKQL